MNISKKCLKLAGFTTAAAVLLSFLSCSTPGRFVVTGLGYEPELVEESLIYALPHTGLKVTVTYQKDVFVPGPYADYARRLLGIEDVRKTRNTEYSMTDATVDAVTEVDGSAFYTLSLLEGEVDLATVDWAEQHGLIMRGNLTTQTGLKDTGDEGPGDVLFKDVTMEPNTEMQEHTIYKTVITDTSFVRVPVTTQQMERKTLEKKAEEAAKLILEIRSDRYYLAAGLVDPLPGGFELETALRELDELEEKYLSLFIGRSFSQQFRQEYFFVPEGGNQAEVMLLTRFSKDAGMVDDESGEPVELVIESSGNAESYRNLLPQDPEDNVYNRLYYRIPEVCDVYIRHSGENICRKRISMYQAGALVNVQIRN